MKTSFTLRLPSRLCIHAYGLRVVRVCSFFKPSALFITGQTDKILVVADRRSKEPTSLVKKTTTKKGSIAVGKEVLVAWVKEEETHKAGRGPWIPLPQSPPARQCHQH